MWPTGFWPTAGVKTLQNTRRKATTARTAGRAEPINAKEGSRRIKACSAFRNPTPDAPFEKIKTGLEYRGAVVPQDLSKLLAGGVDLDQEFERATRTLESIGLSGYEARGYIALVAHGYGSAETIAETAKIPRTSAYKVSEIRENVGKKIEQAIARGIRFTIITEPGQKIPEGASVVNRKGLIATDVIVDGSAALIAAPDLSACGYTDNASLSRHLENFLEIIMNLKE